MSGLSESFWSTLPLGEGVELIARDPNGLVAFSKPAGVLSHPNEKRDQPRSLLTAHYDDAGEFFEWTEVPSAPGDKSAKPRPRRLWLLNRLDSATSGVILAAAAEPLAREIRALFLRRYVKKIYSALVFGVPPAMKQVWHDHLAVQKKGGQIRTAAAGHVPAESHMRVVRSQRGDPSLALIELEPKTGRSHQLRVQCAKRHLPIVGDATYGDFKANREFAKHTGEKRMFLHSLHTTFEYTLAGRSFRFTAKAPLPPEFEAVFGRAH